MDTSKHKSDPTDQTLLIRVAGGDHEAFSCLYDRHAMRLWSIALNLLKDRQAAADAIQETFVKIWKNAAKYRPQLGRPLVWMSFICRNHCIDVIRSGQTAVPAESGWIVNQETSTDIASDPLRYTQEVELRERIAQALQILPTEQRRLIEMVYARGLSHTELAAESGLPVGTVKSRIRLGMQKLRKLLIVEHDVP